MKKSIYQPFFKDKKITVMGLGILGRSVKVAKFLAECGAKLTITDLKSNKELGKPIRELQKYNIKYRLGAHDLRDFEKADMIIKGPSVPLDSPYIKRARSRKIEIAMDASLFARIIRNLKPRATIIGITGTRGKSMTTALIYHILKSNEKKIGKKVHLGGNMRMKATLPLLMEVEAGDIVVLELDSWQTQGFGDEHLSPQIAVFTSFMPDHMNYYKNSMQRYLKDKSNIFKFQKKGDVLITSKNMKKILSLPKNYSGKLVIVNSLKYKNISNVIGRHNMQNVAYAYAVAKRLGLSEPTIQKALKAFPGLEGRLENLGLRRGAHLFNDNNATTPEATVAGIEAVKSLYRKSNIILITGGSDKYLDLKNLLKSIKKHCPEVVLMPGSGTEKLIKGFQTNGFRDFHETVTLTQSIKKAFGLAKKGDVILFSPAFASFASFKNEYDRNEQFMKIIKAKYR